MTYQYIIWYHIKYYNKMRNKKMKKKILLFILYTNTQVFGMQSLKNSFGKLSLLLKNKIFNLKTNYLMMFSPKKEGDFMANAIKNLPEVAEKDRIQIKDLDNLSKMNTYALQQKRKELEDLKVSTIEHYNETYRGIFNDNNIHHHVEKKKANTNIKMLDSALELIDKEISTENPNRKFTKPDDYDNIYVASINSITEKEAINKINTISELNVKKEDILYQLENTEKEIKKLKDSINDFTPQNIADKIVGQIAYQEGLQRIFKERLLPAIEKRITSINNRINLTKE